MREFDLAPYSPPLLLPGGHLQTIYPSMFRDAPQINYRRERLETEDNDFIDLDWSEGGNRRVVVLLHGLEGSSQRSYVRGMVHAFNEAGWDAAAMNFRGCSGEPNRLLRSYHSGETGDLGFVLQRISADDRWDQIGLVGFSLGGNVLLKYLGERAAQVNSKIKAAAAFSVPCDLEDSANQLAMRGNRIYMNKFLRYLRVKIQQKSAMFPEQISMQGFDQLKNFHDFDRRYTAPIHGFRDEIDYWTKSSCNQFLEKIAVPTLIANAKNDPFLGKLCYPYKAAENNSYLTLAVPKSGGHNGFALFDSSGIYWSEKAAVKFLD